MKMDHEKNTTRDNNKCNYLQQTRQTSKEQKHPEQQTKKQNKTKSFLACSQQRERERSEQQEPKGRGNDPNKNKNKNPYLTRDRNPVESAAQKVG